MIIDHRTYTLHPGKLQTYLATYDRLGRELQWKHLGDPIGWYVSHDIGELNQVVHLWRYESLEDRARRRAALAAEPGWQEFLKEGMPMIQHMANKIVTAAPFFTPK
ncbi:MAG: NIPSNAP family protein [Geminicoccaceae bacterium]